MGIETAVLLSYAATAAQVIGAAGAAYGAVEASKKQDIKIPEPEKPMQTAKTADRASVGAANAAAAGGGSLTGNSGTFLTGPSGVDSSLLNLGKNKLLGQ